MSPESTPVDSAIDAPETGGGFSLLDLLVVVAESWKLMVLVPLAVGLVTLAVMYAITPTFTARTTFLPPQPQANAAAAALSSISALAGVGLGNARTPGDQFVSLLQSTTIQDRIIDQFDLAKAYETKLRVDARRLLALNTRVDIGKKDGLITLEIDDESPQRASDIANGHVAALRQLVSELAVTEAQQRRVFFENQLKETHDRLTRAQVALQASGYSSGALRSEPRTAAETYARLKAEVTATEVRLQALRQSLSESAVEVRQLSATLAAQRQQLNQAERSNPVEQGPDYITKYREFKYQETLFDLFARQFEVARLDESRQGAPIQVIDAATPPERRSKPKRVLTAVQATLIAAVLLSGVVLLRHRVRVSIAHDRSTGEKLERIRAAFRLRSKARAGHP